MKEDYEDIIHLPHHISAIRPPMPMKDRAAQFSPFAALRGYDAAIAEKNRLTGRRVELDEYEKEAINRKLCMLAEHQKEKLQVELTCFQPDTRKEGGVYIHRKGIFQKLNPEKRTLLMEDGSEFPIEELFDLQIEEPKKENFPCLKKTTQIESDQY